MLDSGYGTIRPESGVPHWVAERWRLASITKQVTATLLLHDHVDAHDQPVAVGAIVLTLRRLLTHHGGLPDPDATAVNKVAVPAFYTRVADSAPGRPVGLGHAAAKPRRQSTLCVAGRACCWSRNSVPLFRGNTLERAKGFEPSTPTLARLCSTPELRPLWRLRIGVARSRSDRGAAPLASALGVGNSQFRVRDIFA